jgi:hypothetical protein
MQENIMTNRTTDNVIEFPREYLLEQRQRDRWMTIACCSVVMGSDEPTAYVQMILDKFGDAPNRQPNAADIVAHVRFAARMLPEALIQREDMDAAASAVQLVPTENVFNEWIDAWLPAHPC